MHDWLSLCDAVAHQNLISSNETSRKRIASLPPCPPKNWIIDFLFNLTTVQKIFWLKISLYWCFSNDGYALFLAHNVLENVVANRAGLALFICLNKLIITFGVLPVLRWRLLFANLLYAVLVVHLFWQVVTQIKWEFGLIRKTSIGDKTRKKRRCILCRNILR